MASTVTGKVYDHEQIDEMATIFGTGDTLAERRISIVKDMKLRFMNKGLTKKQMINRLVDKYDPCPCGSGKKFKWCCWTG
ncbi:hypothetical protein LCGC14_1239890 [marine sediment metagenome]|uniref:SEC-C motif domain protein n=1 Tax=marine sediment metagenome TaxID=412755 RepID=A0A0F9LTD1_9ZZZZ